jgi:3' exoribonuclease, RNase T-like
MSSLMIDIEGLGTGPDATILTIAAQSFDPFGLGYYNRCYYARITLESQENRNIQQDTIDWWATQPEAQAEAFMEEGRVDLDQALDSLYKLAWQHKFIWANGPTYDMNILEHAYKSSARACPGSSTMYVMLELSTASGQNFPNRLLAIMHLKIAVDRLTCYRLHYDI